MKRAAILITVLALVITTPAVAAKKADHADTPKKPESRMSTETFAGLPLRGIGPAINSGRVVDLAVTPGQRHRYFVAVASGGVWRTENDGTTWTPVFTKQGAYSVGCITMDPNNPNVLWVGTGENSSHRGLGFGDGVYKTLDGGQTWKNMGLKSSERIGMIAVDPRDSNVVYVAASGPVWSSGGDRGIYKTTDGGESWNRIHFISEDTGFNEIHMDPRNPDVLYATSWQRRRHVWTMIDGGPETGIFKSTDAGATWRELTEGLPTEDMGRIGLAVSPADPDVLYAIIESQRDAGGVFRSDDRGESWTKKNGYVSAYPMYFQELFADPNDVDTVYSVDVFLHRTVDGGATWTAMREDTKHVDNHAVWIDPEDSSYLLVGCDGGVYSSFDRGATWRFRANLPVTQFYRVSVDNRKPFYSLCGGTQDNNSLCGPSRTLDGSGITNEDWFVTVGGDGYETVIDPTNSDILYALWQYGGLVRYDRASGEVVDIQPQEAPGEDADRWNWDTPLMISPHSPTRIYVASQRLYRSDDRGDSWTPISGDLSRHLDRDRLPVMGRIWGMDAVGKSQNTSDYGNIVSLTESPLVEGLIYVGTDDGLIQVTEDGGGSWTEIEGVPGVPERTYVSRLEASLHDPDTVYAAFDNHKRGDFTSYAFVSRDRGRSWTSIAGDLPDREIVLAFAQDHVKPGLLFAGTEFGLYVTVDEGTHWIGLKGGFPTIQVRDLDIQRDWNDLAVASYGYGFYILDDYTPLRDVSEEALGNEILFPVRDALLYVEKSSRVISRGDTFFTAPNPPFGALITYSLPEGLETLKEQRIDAEAEARKADAEPPLPSMDDLRAEDLEVDPEILLTVRDASGAVIRRVTGPRTKGIHRVSWDLRYPPATPVTVPAPVLAQWDTPPRGPQVLPGTYNVTLEKKVAGVLTELAPPQTFEVVALDLATLHATDRGAALEFKLAAQRLRRAVSGAVKAAGEASDRIAHIRKALEETPAADAEWMVELERIKSELDSIDLALVGDPTRAARNVFQAPSIVERVERIASDTWVTTQPPTQTHRQAYRWAADAFQTQLGRLHDLFADLEALEAKLEDAGGPWTPGRVPEWK